jgi:hypothetical protein
MKSQRIPGSRRGLTALALVTTAVLAGQTARAADGDNATETAAARAFAIDGMKLAQAGKCEDAIEKLKRAEELHHSPIVLGRLGECYVALGRVVEGSETLRRMLREPMPENPSPAMAQAYEHAQTALDAAKPRIGTLHLSVAVPDGVAAKVTLDGKEISAAVLGGDLPVDPGRHVVSASAPAHVTAAQEVKVDPGGKQTVSLRLVRDPYASPVVQTHSTTGATAQSHSSSPSQKAGQSAPLAPPEEPVSRAPAYVSWLVGAAGIGVGIGFGMSAIDAKNKLTLNCPKGDCDPRYAQDISDAKLKGNIATVGFGVGAAGVVLGTILFATAGDGKKTTESAQLSDGSWASHRPRAWLSPSGVYFGADW